VILLYSCPADALDLELSIHLLNWFEKQGLPCKWLVNCGYIGKILWYGNPLPAPHIMPNDFEQHLQNIEPEFLIVDGLPFGSEGECYEIHNRIPTIWISRRLRWAEYLSDLNITNPSNCGASLVLEPVSSLQMDFVSFGECLQIEFPALDAGPLPTHEGESDSRQWLLLPSLDENQIAQQGGYAMELIEKEQKIPHLLDAAEFDPFELPLGHLVSKYQRVIGGCSYSAACLALQWIGKDLKMGFRWVDQCNSWDDQAGRLRSIRKRSWLKKERSIDWKLWIKQQLESKGLL
tara:strand:+ start:188 stop:1060 length:873 start_codon:yes stop_codon:yes gene_type:complete